MVSAQISTERLSSLIGAIYDCALEPALWQPTLHSICAEFGFFLAGMGVSTLPSGEPLLAASTGMSDHYRNRLSDYTVEIIDAWGGWDKVLQFPLDEPAVHSRDGDATTWNSNRYMIEWVTPQGIVDSIAVVLARDANALGTLTFSRHETAPPIGSREIDGMRLLVPHFQRAVAISRVLDVKSLMASSFEAALETLNSAVLLVDRDRRVVHGNQAAVALLSARDPLAIEGGLLSLRDRVADAALGMAVRHTDKDEASFGRRGLGIPARRQDGSPSVLHVLPLRHGKLRRGLMPTASAAIFVAPAATSMPISDEVAAVLFDLTTAEARVFSHVARGSTVAQVAKSIGVSSSTVRSQLLRLFAKTGTRRQTDLVRLAASLGFDE